jgi:hypothetical protein
MTPMTILRMSPRKFELRPLDYTVKFLPLDDYNKLKSTKISCKQLHSYIHLFKFTSKFSFPSSYSIYKKKSEIMNSFFQSILNYSSINKVPLESQIPHQFSPITPKPNRNYLINSLNKNNNTHAHKTDNREQNHPIEIK